MEPGGSGVAGLGDTAGHRTCSQRAPGLLAAPPAPAPKHWPARGSSRGVGSNCRSGPLSARSERMEYEGTRDGGEEPDRGEGRRPVGDALAAGGALRGGRAREAGALIHGPGQGGELLPGTRGAGSSPRLRCPDERKSRSYNPVFATPHVPLQVGEGARLTNRRAGERGAGRRGGPTGGWASSEPMSSRHFGTPRPITARMEGAAFDWVGAGRDRQREA